MKSVMRLMAAVLFLIAGVCLPAGFADVPDVGEVVVFGRYEQDENQRNGPEPLEWIVIDTDGVRRRVLLITRYIIEARPYHSTRDEISWKDCNLRQWLNGYFFSTAFTADEQAAVPATKVDNSPGQGFSWYNTGWTGPTDDRVFILSYAEAWDFFPDNEARLCMPTKHAVMWGVRTDGLNTGFWWLRSLSVSSGGAECVGLRGGLSLNYANYREVGVRPVLWLDAAGF